MDIEKIFKANMKRQQLETIDKYNLLNTFARKGQILFTGSSLMEQFPINELFMTEGMDQIIYNRGVGGFTTDDMLEHMDTQIFAVEPSKIFINIGTNDISNPTVSFGNCVGAYYQKLHRNSHTDPDKASARPKYI